MAAVQWSWSWVAAVFCGVALETASRQSAPPAPAAPPPPPAAAAYADPKALTEVWAKGTGRQEEFASVSTGLARRHVWPDFAYTFPVRDEDHKQAADMGVVEPYPSYHLVRMLSGCCARGGHFVDVGGHFGWYASLASALGCDVDAFEPVPWYAAVLDYNLANNGFTNRRSVHKDAVVGATRKAGEAVTLRVPKDGLFGTAGVAGRGAQPDGEYVELQRATTSLDSFDMIRSGQEACGLKIDVEGYEAEVLEGGAAYIEQHRPKQIMFELSPIKGKALYGGDVAAALGRPIDKLVGMGYSASLLYWGDIKHADPEYPFRYDIDRVRLNNPGQDGAALVEFCRDVCMMVFDRVVQ
eukprot:TRINITY_DN9906_c0_g1_i1.p1 TRINITY_DN9906_c0_g1~~TRINITY_DN9906_c0_g1_i1.p1  ORF type:complete len:354 (+),score=136.14 TRINITY_DN9906_c0_g1_i1:60-1121(+)